MLRLANEKQNRRTERLKHKKQYNEPPLAWVVSTQCAVLPERRKKKRIVLVHHVHILFMHRFRSFHAYSTLHTPHTAHEYSSPNIRRNPCSLIHYFIGINSNARAQYNCHYLQILIVNSPWYCALRSQCVLLFAPWSLDLSSIYIYIRTYCARLW